MFWRPFAADLHTWAAQNPWTHYSLITIFHAQKISLRFFSFHFALIQRGCGEFVNEVIFWTELRNNQLFQIYEMWNQIETNVDQAFRPFFLESSDDLSETSKNCRKLPKIVKNPDFDFCMFNKWIEKI